MANLGQRNVREKWLGVNILVSSEGIRGESKLTKRVSGRKRRRQKRVLRVMQPLSPRLSSFRSEYSLVIESGISRQKNGIEREMDAISQYFPFRDEM